MNWNKLLSPARRKELNSGKKESTGTGLGRTEFERDFDRILFASPTRRLADKTQVFPMEQHDSVRNRLTHSYEVSNIARSIGTRLVFENVDLFGEIDKEVLYRSIPSMLGAIGLAHDLGNPPFGHQGEIAIQQWFLNKKQNRKLDGGDVKSCCDKDFEDFISFDGNAQTFRLLTRLQVLNDDFGLNLTVATLAALIKYPSISGGGKFGYKKWGVFSSEKDIAMQVWEECGLKLGVRHPLTYVMEACDDIAYSIIDAEDTIKKGYASFYDLIDYLSKNEGDDDVTKKVLDFSRQKNEEFKLENLSSSELNDLSMQMFRVKSIQLMVDEVTASFNNNYQDIVGEQKIKSLIESSQAGEFCSRVKRFDYEYGFKNKEVLRLELKGNNYITGMLDILWDSICHKDDNGKAFERYVYGSLSENYRRVYESSNKTCYNKFQLMTDVVSGMTESYLIKKYHEFEELRNI